MVEAAPGSLDAQREVALAALRVLRPREALSLLAKLDPERGLMREWSVYWSAVTWAHHLLGEHDEELAAARRGRQLFPNALFYAELRALAALGRLAEVDSLARVQFSSRPGLAGPMGFEIAGELLAHGHPEAARRLARYAQDLVANHPLPDSLGKQGRDEWLAQRARLALLLVNTDMAAALVAQFRYPEERRLLLAHVLAARGRRDSALATLQDWKKWRMQLSRSPSPWDRNLALNAAGVLVHLGDLDGALETLAGTPPTDPIFLNTPGRDGHADPWLAPLWSDPRFRALIKPRG
jgi:hypothetical protein